MDSNIESIHVATPRGSSSDGDVLANSGAVAGEGRSSGGATETAAGVQATEESSSLSTAPNPTPNHNNPNNASPSSPPSKHTVLHTHRQNHNSSKLPAFRFADLKKEQQQHITLGLPLLVHNHIPPSPVSPEPAPDQHQEQQREAQPTTDHHSSPPQPPPLTTIQQGNHNSESREPVSPQTESIPEPVPGSRQSRPVAEPEQSPPVGSRTSAFQQPGTNHVPATTRATIASQTKRSTSLDSSTPIRSIEAGNLSNAAIVSPCDSLETLVVTRPRQGRAATSPNARTTGTSLNTTKSSRRVASIDGSTQEWAQGQRELLLPKVVQRTLSDDRRVSMSRRPPISYKPPTNSSPSGGTTAVPPIRSFRSSGERKSLVLNMNLRSPRPYDAGDDFNNAHHRDRSLRALEGRRGEDAQQMTPPDSATDRIDNDNTDMFLKIAREDSTQYDPDGISSENALTRTSRSTRRPLSVAISSYPPPTSPPQMLRRLSEQETSRSRSMNHDLSGERTIRPVASRGLSREKQLDDTKSRGTVTPIRGSQFTPRTSYFQDSPAEQGSSYTRRRQPSVDAGSAVPSRLTSMKQGSVNYSHPRTYSSSPLAPRSGDPPKPDVQSGDANQGREGTDSTLSTAAPSTVWDELDDLKSRIHRLELTGKLPPTSGAAMSRASEERPPTAHTNATTMSASPRRGGSGSAVDASDATTVQKEAHPVLHSALAKSKEILSAGIYGALETATNDALALSGMMSIPGQPGPISSGASNIGSLNGATMTDRQLRRKADSICRSLTELCLALNEGLANSKAREAAAEPCDDVTVTSPAVTKPPVRPQQRRASISADRGLPFHSPRGGLSRFDDKRSNVLMTSALPSPRYSSTTPATPTDVAPTGPAGRRTSLLISRTRRAGTEEPEDGHRSSLLRTRRAGTEEPEDNRQSSLLRTRRAGTEEPEDHRTDRRALVTRRRPGMLEDEGEETRFRAPSRAFTEVQGTRAGTREYLSQVPSRLTKDSDPLANSALPRSRLPSTTLNTRLVQPAATTGLTTPSRRYFDRGAPPTREMVTFTDNQSAEERPRRQFSLARAGSLNKRTNRDSMIAVPPTTTGSFR